MAHLGVLLAAYGGPRSLDEVEPFMSSIMGVAPSEPVLSDAHRRYLTIGGSSPLPFMAERIAVQLERSLSGLEPAQSDDTEGMGFMGLPAALPRAASGVRIPVAVGMLHSEPTIGSALARLVDAGARTIVLLPLSPFDTPTTTGAYRAALDAAVAGTGTPVKVIEAADYHVARPFVQALSDSLAFAFGADELKGKRAFVVMTAHSLTTAEIDSDPSYVQQLRQTAAAVAESMAFEPPSEEEVFPGLSGFGTSQGIVPWMLAFQSAGRRGGEWIGPALSTVIAKVIASGDFEAIVVSPLGFALDHLETLYDLDVLAAEEVLDAGLEFARASAANDSADMIEALAEAVRKVS